MQDGQKWGDKTQDKKNGEMRRETKKWEDEMRDKKNWGDKTRDKKMGR